jgi:hypothetical protein
MFLSVCNLTVCARSSNLHGYDIRHDVGRIVGIVKFCRQEFRWIMGWEESILGLRSIYHLIFYFVQPIYV